MRKPNSDSLRVVLRMVLISNTERKRGRYRGVKRIHQCGESQAKGEHVINTTAKGILLCWFISCSLYSGTTPVQT